ncbi:MAG: signal transduction protein fusion protein : serine/threonine protein kinase [Ramlibacter sp.]|jgi:anti-sigma regulatory factor (Ser/Thr protein kinase)|uniref:ATP-binding protein n=1 Tax=Ramlibacter sp. TaxID=1917967 RepID=UPI002A45A34E|nr:signal transduction protein fusion protein : serine/threonine protein kinase [Ramlibacter sp.]
MIIGSSHAVFPIGDPSRVGEARRYAAQLGYECGLDETESGRLALVVTELTTNLLLHATGGRLLVSARQGRGEVEVIAIDEGPGIADVHRALDDGYSTGGTSGTGLGAVRRLATQFDLHSAVAQGTIVVARVRSAAALPAAPGAAQAIEVGAVALAAPGERVCGDAWAFALDGQQAAMIVADGLGHGPDAAEASAAALEAFAQDPMAPPRDLLERIHVRLRRTRGAAVMMFLADAAAGVIRSCGAGNVAGRLVSGTSDRSVLSQHGTAGITIRTPEENSTPWPPHAMLVVCSDGVATRWKSEILAPLLGRDPALAAGLLARDHCRGRDDATVAILRRKD